MQPEQWQKIETIFYAALPMPSSEWGTFVSSQCKGDEEMSARILDLLSEDENGTLDLLDISFFEVGARLITAADELLEGQQFGPYMIERLLGRGGMGTVYLAEDSRLNRSVAIKVLPAAFIDGSFAIKRFHREARAASKINHENVAHIYEFGAIDGRYFLAMEYVPGRTLRELIREGSINRSLAIDYALQSAVALASAHRNNVVHRDIKPENIAVRDDGVVKVLDFGLAQQKASLDKPGSRSGSLSGILMGTTSYMSPEQVRAQDLDERTDLWSLGVVLYEMLAGSRPFKGETPTELHAAILADELPDPKLDHSYSRIYRIAEKCLQKERNDRYPTAESLVDDLRSAQSDSSSINSRRMWIGAGLLGLILAVAAVIWFFGIGTARTASAKPIESVAILPFTNDSGTSDKEYLVDGMTETLAASISQMPGLTVKARSSVFKYKGNDIDAVSAGRDLSVQAVLLGRMAERSDRVMLSLSLVDVASGQQIWGKEYERPSSDILGLQKQAALDLSGELNRRLSGDDKRRLTKLYTTNPEAFDNYLIGRFYWNKRTGKDLKKSVEYFQSAIKTDPDFALAFAGLADSQLLLSSYAGIPPQESFPNAKASALKALELDESLAEAHTTLAYELFVYDWNFDESDRQMSRAIELNPNYATAYHWYGNGSLLAMGRFDESIEAMKHARRLEPLSLIINADLGTSYLYALRLDEAIAQFQKTLEMDSNFYYAHVYLGRAYLLRGDYQKAIDELQTADKIEDDARIPMLLSRVYSKMGRRKDALRQLEELKKMAAKQYVSNFDYAIVYAGLGDSDQAFEYLENGFRNHDGNMVYIKADPLLADLRQDPRYFDLARRIGLEK
jgi:Serine/threonine protein kinase